MVNHLSRVRAFLLDLDGTFYLGDALTPGALSFIDTIQRHQKDYLFLTNNSSKHPRQYAAKIRRLGLPIGEDKIFSSSQATALYLREANIASRSGELPRLFILGTPDLEEGFCQAGFVLDADQPQAVVLGFDTTLTYEKLQKCCRFVRDGLPYLATHADINCPTANGFIPDAGALIALVKASTGREPDIILGKPNPIIATMAARILGLPLDSLAMVGDRLYTDIALGQTSGILTVLVLSGETRLTDLERSPYQPDLIFEHLGEFAAALDRTL